MSFSLFFTWNIKMDASKINSLLASIHSSTGNPSFDVTLTQLTSILTVIYNKNTDELYVSLRKLKEIKDSVVSNICNLDMPMYMPGYKPWDHMLPCSPIGPGYNPNYNQPPWREWSSQQYKDFQNNLSRFEQAKELTYEQCLNLIKEDINNIKQIHPKYRNVALCLQVLRKDKNMFTYFDQNILKEAERIMAEDK